MSSFVTFHRLHLLLLHLLIPLSSAFSHTKSNRLLWKVTILPHICMIACSEKNNLSIFSSPGRGKCSLLSIYHPCLRAPTAINGFDSATPCLKKNSQNCFRQNFVKFPPTFIIFGTKMAKRLKLYEVHSFSTSPNSCYHTTV